MIRLYLIDDHQFIIDGIKRMMESEPDIEICGSETNAHKAIASLCSSDLEVDVVICDLSMPVMTGLELLGEVRSKNPTQKIIILTMHDDGENVRAIADAEADGYVLKSGNPAQFIDAIRVVADGGSYYSAEIIHHLYKSVKDSQSIADDLGKLTEREIEILKLVLQEKSSHEIADLLYISKQTVDTHRKNLLHKSGETNIIGLVKFGLRNGLLD